MAQEVITWCDKHLSTDERVPAGPVTISIDGARPRALDLCDECRKEVLGPLSELMEYGRDVAAAPSGNHAPVNPRLKQGVRSGANSPGERVIVVCPLCADQGRLYEQTRSVMRTHMETEHQRRLGAVEAERGSTLDGQPLPYRCEVDGCGEGFATPQGYGAHQHARHGIAGTTSSAASGSAQSSSET